MINILIILVVLELVAMITVKTLRKRFQWLITPEDELPELDEDGLKKFIEHGFDAELGWIRKPNTSHPEKGKYGDTSYTIGAAGCRAHPGLEKLDMKIACFGDSFTFSRQVNDNETWPYNLSKLTGLGVANYGVGNYGLDQALMRLLREREKISPDVIIMGVVPSTIVRVLCVWKHYNEFGNTFGFKPRYDIKDGKLTLIKNIIDSENKLKNYKDHIKDIRSNDYFYAGKFKNEMLRFPYIYSIIKNPCRNIPLILSVAASVLLAVLGVKIKKLDEYPHMKIMEINKKLRLDLFNNNYALDLMRAIVYEFAATAEKIGAKPVFLFMPQKDDVILVKDGVSYYDSFIKNIKERLITIDLTEYLLKRGDLDALYSDDNVYGGHYSREGNVFVAETINKVLVENGYIKYEQHVKS